MSHLITVATLLVMTFAPLVAQAQALGDGLTAPPSYTLQAPSSGTGDLTTYVVEDAPVQDGPTLMQSFGDGWLGFGIGAGTGALAGGAIMGAACGGGGGDGVWCPIFVLVGAAGGAMVLAPMGAGISVWARGEARGGTGNGFAAIGGAYLGEGIGVGLAALLAGMDQAGPGAIVGIVAGLVLSNLGAAAGYHLSSHGSQSAESEDLAHAERGVIALPTLAATADGRGAVAGVAGMF